MKAVILAGGLGTYISEEAQGRPKPMVEIGGQPILWHVMKMYSTHGIHDFFICLGYKGYMIKEYFANYFLHMSDVTFDLKENRMEIHQRYADPWRVTLVDTGDATMTGGRLKRVRSYLGDEPFCFTYGDGLANIDLRALTEFHRDQGTLATVAMVRPPGDFAVMDMERNRITGSRESPNGDGGWINGGFFVLSPGVFDYIEGDATVWDKAPIERLARDGQLAAFRHDGFWQRMDTLRDRILLQKLWNSGAAPWRIWQ